MYNSKLEFPGIELQVSIGCLPEEKLTRQRIILDIAISFSSPPQGAITDEIKDTYSYTNLVFLIKEFINTRHFNLIENLAVSTHDLIIKDLVAKNYTNSCVKVKVTKFPASIPELFHGASFTYSSF